jgi:hypothetical protein
MNQAVSDHDVEIITGRIFDLDQGLMLCSSNHDCLTAALDSIKSHLQVHLRDEHTLFAGGSFGKGTAVAGKPTDLDLLVEFPTPVDYGLAKLAVLVKAKLDDLQTVISKLPQVSSMKRNVRSVKFILAGDKEDVEVDLLPCFDIRPYEIAWLGFHQQITLQAGLNREQVKFVGSRILKLDKCGPLINLAKWWRDLIEKAVYNAAFQNYNPDVNRGVRISSYLMELCAIHACELAEHKKNCNLGDVFAVFLKVVHTVMSQRLALVWDDNYTRDLIPVETMEAPLVICPANPTNNVAANLNSCEKGGITVCDALADIAQQWLNRFACDISVEVESSIPVSQFQTVSKKVLEIERTYLLFLQNLSLTENQSVVDRSKEHFETATKNYNKTPDSSTIRGDIKKDPVARDLEPCDLQKLLGDVANIEEAAAKIRIRHISDLVKTVEVLSKTKKLDLSCDIVYSEEDYVEWSKFRQMQDRICKMQNNSQIIHARGLISARVSHCQAIRLFASGVWFQGINRMWYALTNGFRDGVSLPQGRLSPLFEEIKCLLNVVVTTSHVSRHQWWLILQSFVLLLILLRNTDDWGAQYQYYLDLHKFLLAYKALDECDFLNNDLPELYAVVQVERLLTKRRLASICRFTKNGVVQSKADVQQRIKDRGTFLQSKLNDSNDPSGFLREEVVSLCSGKI